MPWTRIQYFPYVAVLWFTRYATRDSGDITKSSEEKADATLNETEFGHFIPKNRSFEKE